MHVIVSKADLTSATNRLQGALSEKNLAHIGLRTKGGELHIAAADRLLAIYCSLPSEIHQEGSAFVPAKLFSDVVKELPAGPVSLQVSDNWLVISAGDNQPFVMKLPLTKDAAWQEQPELAATSVASVPALQLAYMISQVQFCIATESSRNYGSVCLLHRVDNKTLRLVGTDGFRLSYCDISFPMPENFLATGVCLTKRALGELARMCHEGFEQIELKISEDETNLCARVEGYSIYLLLSAVKYPKYQGVLPNKLPAQVSAPRQVLQNVARRVLLAAGKTKALQLRFAESTLTMSSKSMGNAEGRERIPLADYAGAACGMAINGKYLSDIFSATTSEDLLIQFANEEKPIMLVPLMEPSNCCSKHVLVPIRESE
jgi:DNA polymerase-3 subunit beta